MLNILIDAYAIAPNWGSEQGMGWNWVSNLAKFCNLYIITEGEWQTEIEQSLSAAMMNNMDKTVNPTGLTRHQAENMHFFYLPVSKEVREMCWNQGTWKFYMYYEQWERRAYEKAQEIISELKAESLELKEHREIDVIHKLNMICYREPGYLWKIKNKPFVWGPIGGYAGMTNPYMKDEPIVSLFKENLKNFLNYLTFHFQPRVGKAARRADAIVGAYKETYEALRDVYRPDTVLINETGAFIDETSKPHASDKKELNLLWVGKYDLRKQLGIAIRTMELLKDKKNIHLWVAGNGYPKDVEKYTKMVEDKGLKENVHLMGVVPNVKTREMMKEMDIFFFTSVHDATSTVVPEAISAGLPVVCHDMRGFGVIVDDEIGRKVQPKDPEASAQEFAKIIADLDTERDTLRQLSAGCIDRQREISWEANARKMVKEYEKEVERFKAKKK